jgi:hypothetical protein
MFSHLRAEARTVSAPEELPRLPKKLSGAPGTISLPQELYYEPER